MTKKQNYIHTTGLGENSIHPSSQDEIKIIRKLVIEEAKARSQPKKRVLLVGMANGGTTATTKCFLQHPSIQISSAIMKREGYLYIPTGYGEDRLLLYTEYGQSLFFYGSGPKPILFDKESIAYTHPRMKYPLFPHESMVPDNKYDNSQLFYILLFRNPVHVWNSWTRRGWNSDSSIDILVQGYERLDSLGDIANDAGINAAKICFEDFLLNPEDYLKSICQLIDIPYVEQMVNWEIPWGNRWGAQYNPLIDKEGLKKPSVPEWVISKPEKSQIQERLGHIYDKVKTMDIKDSLGFLNKKQ